MMAMTVRRFRSYYAEIERIESRRALLLLRVMNAATVGGDPATHLQDELLAIVNGESESDDGEQTVTLKQFAQILGM